MPITCLPRRAYSLIATMLIAATLAGCGTTKPARGVATSGFLGNYALLRKSEGDGPLMYYADPKADCKKYSKILIEPVTLWAKAPDSPLAKLDPKDQSMLVSEATQAINAAVAHGGFQVATQPGPDVMTLRSAITEADKANVAMKEISIVAPYASGAATLWALGKGQALFTGDAAFELELLDSMNGNRLYAAVDKRVGKMDPRNYHGWDDVKEAMKLWQERGGKRLLNCRTSGSFVPKSQEKSLEEKVDTYMP